MARDGAGPLVVGAGSIGLRHAKNLRDLGEKEVTLCDLDGARLRAAEEAGFSVTTRFEKAIEGRPRFVAICTPPRSHVALAKAALSAGLPVFVEKPLADSLDGVAELVALAAQSGEPTLVGCNLRFHPGLLAVRRLLDGGEIGRPLAAHAHSGSYLPGWRPVDYRTTYSAQKAQGGGVVLDAIHEIDYVRWLFGEPRSVVATVARSGALDADVEDVADLTFETGGPLVHVHLDYIQRDYLRTLRVTGADGTAYWDFSSPEVLVRRASDEPMRVALPKWQVNDMYVDEMRHWLRVVDGKERSALDLAGGSRDLEIALTALRSAEAGRRLPL